MVDMPPFLQGSQLYRLPVCIPIDKAPLEKCFPLKGRMFSSGVHLFCFRVDPLGQGRQNLFDRVSFLTSISILPIMLAFVKDQLSLHDGRIC